MFLFFFIIGFIWGSNVREGFLKFRLELGTKYWECYFKDCGFYLVENKELFSVI